jgi:hypothetical protein
MKQFYFPILALLGLPFAALSAERPDGTLGVDYVSANYTYYGTDYGYYKEGHSYDHSYAVALNKNVLESASWGLDARARYFYVTNISDSDLYDMDQHSGELGLTAYRKGMLSPYVSFTANYRHMSVDAKDGGEDESSDGWQLDGRVGVEIHLLPGFAANFAIGNTHNCSTGSPKNYPRYVAGLSYWFSDEMGLSLAETYSPFMHVDSYATSLGLLFRY